MGMTVLYFFGRIATVSDQETFLRFTEGWRATLAADSVGQAISTSVPTDAQEVFIRMPVRPVTAVRILRKNMRMRHGSRKRCLIRINLLMPVSNPPATFVPLPTR
jgi:hypothetical protein